MSATIDVQRVCGYWRRAPPTESGAQEDTDRIECTSSPIRVGGGGVGPFTEQTSVSLLASTTSNNRGATSHSPSISLCSGAQSFSGFSHASMVIPTNYSTVCELAPTGSLAHTRDVEHFSSFTTAEHQERCAAAYAIEGRRYPVDIFFATESHPDYLTASLALALQYHRTRPSEYSLQLSLPFFLLPLFYTPFVRFAYVHFCSRQLHIWLRNFASEGILIFLTGEEEIQTAARTLRKAIRHLHSGIIALGVLLKINL